MRVTYEHLLEADGNRVDYALPRSESLANALPWRVELDLRAEAPISTVYSPSHELDVERLSKSRLKVRVKETSTADPGPFLLSYLLERDGVSASLLAYPDPSVGGGYFLLMAGLPASFEEAETKLLREVTLVLDRSGSMAGEKMEQVVAAARQVIEGLDPGEAFNVIDYASQVSMFAPGPVVKDARTIGEVREYLARLRPTGGTNIHDALLEALRQPRRRGHALDRAVPDRRDCRRWGTPPRSRSAPWSRRRAAARGGSSPSGWGTTSTCPCSTASRT